MSRYAVISTKVRRELLEEARRLGINVSALIREALEEEIQHRRIAELENRLKKKRNILNKLDVDEIVEIIRENRETR